MLRFIEDTGHKDDDGDEFQYIPCYGLSQSGKRAPKIHADFNTSHVTVYLSLTMQEIQSRRDFNTSHVTVYPIVTNASTGTK